ncbi:hypothetical protein [Spirosoma endophyticum]|uniref:Uncharacterized protein n=1 Tax=Spirosoma endophyticum TaxID=662367 RepID=A0A1I2HPD7_9BACT|nr:hypothetical protein [Spirosoma endophyticum]SFF31669.1 hypothetical protein SAMN05216167_14626 [Spirosoma endophyticum]
MTKIEFISFVRKTLEELIQYAEIYAEKEFPRALAFKWMGETNWEYDQKEILNKLVDRVYQGEEQIYPCVDLIVKGIKAGKVEVEGRVAGYEPRAFQKGWSGRMGPFIYGFGFATPTDKAKLESIRSKLIQKGLLPG